MLSGWTVSRMVRLSAQGALRRDGEVAGKSPPRDRSGRRVSPWHTVHTVTMTKQTSSPRGVALGKTIILALVIATSVCAALPSWSIAAEPSSVPATTASLEPTLAPAQAACESADNLRLVIDFLRGTDVSEDGWLPVFVGVIAGLSEAQGLAGLVGDAYRPLVDDLIVSLEGLRTTVEELRDQGTIGAGLADIGEAITDIGIALDALSVQLRSPCPTDD